MSKIAEQKALEAYPITNDMTDFQRQYERYAYLKGYDQAMQDFLEKAVKWLNDNQRTYREYDESGFYHKESQHLIEDFKNHMENEI